MKYITRYILAFSLGLFITTGLFAQNPMQGMEQKEIKKTVVRKTPSKRKVKKDKAEKNTRLSVRAKEFNKNLRGNYTTTPWKRIIYRELSLDSVANTALYYPPRPTQERQNLFTTLFALIAKGEIPAYEYLDGEEILDDAHSLKFGDFLDRFAIMYEEDPTAEGLAKYKISPVDIPSDLVKAYFVKEEYYFDPINSTIDRRVLALCPVLYDTGDVGEGLHFPLFWVSYEDIRPYLSTLPVMLSDLNNSMQTTMENYFRMSLYKGDIYKTRNRWGRALAQYCPTPDSLKHERARIELELTSFQKDLWEKKVVKEEESDSKEEITKDNTEGKTARARLQKSKKKKSSYKSSKKSKKRKSKSRRKKSRSNKRSARSRF